MTQNHCEPIKKERAYQLLPNSSGAKNLTSRFWISED